MNYDEMVRYTIGHFVKLARENRFPENGRIPHDTTKCLVCNHEQIQGDARSFLLDLVLECISERRPKLDDDLVEAIKEELAMQGVNSMIDWKDLVEGSPEAFEAWKIWAWNAINTAFDMLSMHGDSTPYLQLEDNFSENEINMSLRKLFDKQRANTLNQDSRKMK